MDPPTTALAPGELLTERPAVTVTVMLTLTANEVAQATWLSAQSAVSPSSDGEASAEYLRH